MEPRDSHCGAASGDEDAVARGDVAGAVTRGDEVATHRAVLLVELHHVTSGLDVQVIRVLRGETSTTNHETLMCRMRHDAVGLDVSILQWPLFLECRGSFPLWGSWEFV